MKSAFSVAVLAALGAVFWLGWTSREAAPASASAAIKHSAVALSISTRDEAMPDVFVPPIPSEQIREQTLKQRRAALPVVLKAADDDMARLKRDIEAARAQEAPAVDIAEMEGRLQRMQDVLARVLARNSDIRL